MGRFRNQFQNGFVIQRRLQRFFQPRLAERLQPRNVVGRDDVIFQQWRVEREHRPGVRVEGGGFKYFLRALKSGNGRARLRTWS